MCRMLDKEMLASNSELEKEMHIGGSARDSHESAIAGASVSKEATGINEASSSAGRAVEDRAGVSDVSDIDADNAANAFSDAGKLPTWRFVVIMICLCLGLFMSLMDTAIVSTALYTISEEFGDFNISGWAILSYTLAYVGFAVFVTRLSDVYGRKWLLLACFAIFSAMSLACAWSTNMIQLIVFRGLQGIGGAGLYSLSMVIFPEISGLGRNAMVSAIVGAVLAVSGVCGPILGGVFTSEATWRWCFWINGPAGIIPMFVVYFVWPHDFNPGPLKRPRLANLDYLGAFLMLIGSVLLVFILSQAATKAFDWSSGVVIVVLIISLLSWVALFTWEWFILWHPRYKSLVPHFPFRLLRNRVMFGAILNTFWTGFVLLLLVVNIPLRAEIVNSSNAIQAGLRLVPLVGGSAFGSLLSGAVSSKKNNTTAALSIGACLMIIGAALLSTLENTRSTSQKQWGFEVILGTGLGMSLANATMITVLNTERQDHAIAQGIVAQVRILGGSIGIAIASVVTNNRVHKYVAPIVTPQQLAAFNVFPGNIYSWTVVQQATVREVYSNSFQVNMKVCAGMAAACFVSALATYQKNPPLVRGPKRPDLETPVGDPVGDDRV